MSTYPLTPFRPAAGHLLIRMDVKARSSLLLNAGKPKLLPSGKVVAIGPDAIVQGIGKVSSDYSVGDHVVVEPQLIRPMPLTPNGTKDSEGVPVIHVLVQETGLLGVFPEGADPDSPWFQYDDLEDFQEAVMQ